MTESQTVTLTDEVRIPLVGFGTYLIRNEDAAATVSAALRAGYRHVDTAEGYRNEEGVGAGLREAMRSEGLSRDDLFVTTKLWPGNEAWGQTLKTTEATISSLEASLGRLGLDFVDLYLIHAPYGGKLRVAQWEGLLELQRRGRARAIGVSNYSVAHLEEIAAAGLPLPSANQIELHPWSQKPALVSYLAAHTIRPIAYSSLIPLSTWRTAPGQESGKTDEMRSDGAREDSPFRAMANKHGVGEAQVLLRWAIQRGYPVLPKTTNPERMRQNLDVFSFSLDADDMAAIATMDRGDGVAWRGGDPTHAP